MSFRRNGNYIGLFKNREITGFGRWFNPESGDLYEGQILQGGRHGYARYIWADGGHYIGFYKDGKACGQGKYISPDGSNICEGQWEDDSLKGYSGSSFSDII